MFSNLYLLLYKYKFENIKEFIPRQKSSNLYLLLYKYKFDDYQEVLHW